MKQIPDNFFPKSIKGPKNEFNYLMQEERMKGFYLGSCLDETRWGSPYDVMWEETIPDMIQFILKWLEINQGDLQFHTNPEATTELPYLYNRDHCIHPNHKGTFKDQAGRVRCRHIDFIRIPKNTGKHTYFDEFEQSHITTFFGSTPYNPKTDSRLLDKDNEEVIEVPCYAILSDRTTILSLEKVLERLNKRPRYHTKYCYDLARCEKDKGMSCIGHKEEITEYVYPSDGWSLAVKIKMWHEQLEDKSQLPIFNKTNLEQVA